MKVAGVEGVQGAGRTHIPLSVPEQSPSARSLASGSLEEEESAVSSKELGEWLRQHPTYTMDMAGFTPVSPSSVELSVPLLHLQSFVSCLLPSFSVLRKPQGSHSHLCVVLPPAEE